MHDLEADAAAGPSAADPSPLQPPLGQKPLSPSQELDETNIATKHELDTTTTPTTTMTTTPAATAMDLKTDTTVLDATASAADAPDMENKMLFYMDNTPRQATLVAKNSELAGDDDDDEEDGVDSESWDKSPGTARHNPVIGSCNNKKSLASVAGTAIETLVGLAMIVPDALISPKDDFASTARTRQDSGSADNEESEVYLDEDGVGQQNHAPLLTATPSPREPHSSGLEACTTPLDVNNESTPTPQSARVATTTAGPVAQETTTTTSQALDADSDSLPADVQESPSRSGSTTPSPGSKPCEIGASKDILTEGQAFAYVGLCLVTANSLFQALEGTESGHAKESLESFVSKLINRLYRHLDIDAATQKTIAQLPMMMIQPEDLLETFIADGTQRVVSSQQVDQAGLSMSGPSSPVVSRHSRQFSVTSVSSRASFSGGLPNRATTPTPVSNNLVRSDSFSTLTNDTVKNSSSSISSSSTISISSLPRESVSSRTSETSFSSVSLEAAPVDATPKVSSEDTVSFGADNRSTLVSDSRPPSRASLASQKAITVDLRWTMIADLFLISISDSVYDSRARILLKTVGRHLGLEWHEIVLFEKGIMKQLQQSTTSDGLLKPDTKSRNDESRKRRMIMMGLATVGGGLVLGLSAGLFAPVIGAGIGAALAGAHITGATATAASAFLAGSGGIAVITSGAAVTGSGIAMKKMARRTAGIDTFEFLSIHDNRRVNVILTISGWLDIGDEDASLPFSTLDPVNGDQFALFWEPEMLMQLGNALGLLATEVITLTAQEILKHTLLSALLSALAWPMALTRLGYLIDNPWSIALDRAKLAGLVLADSLLMRSYLGFRPVTLIGYSLGARVIFYCLLELGRLDAFGIVEDAFLFGAPVTASDSQWRQAKSAVAGEFVNGYLRNDWVLGFLFRATTGGLGTVAGLRPIKNVPGLINMDLTDHVEGHLDYRVKIPLLMKLMGLKVTSESFLEKEEAILHQRSLKINPSETLKAPKPMMPSKAELANSASLSEKEKMQLEAAFRRPAPKAKIPDLESLTGLTPEEKAALKEALEAAAAANAGSPVDTWTRK